MLGLISPTFGFFHSPLGLLLPKFLIDSPSPICQLFLLELSAKCIPNNIGNSDLKPRPVPETMPLILQGACLCYNQTYSLSHNPSTQDSSTNP